ncbi:MAG: TIGR00730 family Rossman fold protein [Cyclobacteriaceae bacterium]
MKSVCVFCASSKGSEPYFVEQSYALGQYLAGNNIRLIFGGSKVGLMGEVARGVIENGGEVTGVIPAFLARKEVAHDGIQELITVETMHQRKTKMSELSEGFIALPGGFGTLEELCEILTWAQLQLIKAPVGVLNWKGYYTHLVSQINRMMEDELLKKANAELLLIGDNHKELVDLMDQYEPPNESFWAKLDLT